MRITIADTLDTLIGDLAETGERLNRALDGAVKDVAQQGNRLAQANARRTASSHGKRYPAAFRVEQRGVGDYVYGPIVGPPQGGMSFEFGSRRQPPHLDLAKSADVIGPKLADKVDEVIRKALE